MKLLGTFIITRLLDGSLLKLKHVYKTMPSGRYQPSHKPAQYFEQLQLVDHPIFLRQKWLVLKEWLIR
jgi:hypothetical protein